MSPPRAHVLLSVLYVASRLVLALAGLRFSLSLDWMWLADPADLRDRLFETLLYFHAFPPGINALTGIVLKVSEGHASFVAQGLFFSLGLVFANALCYLGRAIGLSAAAALWFALVFSLTPAFLYFEHLFHYEIPVATMLCASAVLFHKALTTRARIYWFAFFSVSAAISLTRSTFHLVWFAALLVLGARLSVLGARRLAIVAAIVPALCLTSVYAKNLVLFGEFAASTFGPAAYTLVTVAQLPDNLRDEWIREGHLSSFAAISVYAPPRQYSKFFATTDHGGWPPQLTRLDHYGVKAPNFNHWWLLEVHRTRRQDVFYYLRHRPLEYGANVMTGLRELFTASTTWHPRDGTPLSPHYQHRQVLGGYERWFNAFFHTLPIAPFGVYVVLVPLLIWGSIAARNLLRHADPALRARGALLIFCIFQIVYVVAASSMLTFLESSRYRFQIEWAIWLLVACGVQSALRTLRARRGLRAAPHGSR